METSEKFYKVGDKFRFDDGRLCGSYILVRTSPGRIQLIDLDGGDRWNRGKNVSCLKIIKGISKEEFELIVGCKDAVKYFKKVSTAEYYGNFLKDREHFPEEFK